MAFSTEIIKILDDLGKRIGIAIDWSNENIIPYLNCLLERFVKWEIASSTLWIVIGVVLLVIGTLKTKSVWEKGKDNSFFGDFDEGITWAFIATISFTVIGMILIICNCENIIEAIYLPEKVIYEYVKDFI